MIRREGDGPGVKGAAALCAALLAVAGEASGCSCLARPAGPVTPAAEAAGCTTSTASSPSCGSSRCSAAADRSTTSSPRWRSWNRSKARASSSGCARPAARRAAASSSRQGERRLYFMGRGRQRLSLRQPVAAERADPAGRVAQAEGAAGAAAGRGARFLGADRACPRRRRGLPGDRLPRPPRHAGDGGPALDGARRGQHHGRRHRRAPAAPVRRPHPRADRAHQPLAEAGRLRARAGAGGRGPLRDRRAAQGRARRGARAARAAGGRGVWMRHLGRRTGYSGEGEILFYLQQGGEPFFTLTWWVS